MSDTGRAPAAHRSIAAPAEVPTMAKKKPKSEKKSTSKPYIPVLIHSDDERKRIQLAAALLGMSASSYARFVVLKETERVLAEKVKGKLEFPADKG